MTAIDADPGLAEAPPARLSAGQVAAAVVIVPGLVLVATAVLVVVGRVLGALFDGASPPVLVVALAWAAAAAACLLGVRAAIPWYADRFGAFAEALVGSTAGWRVHAEGLVAGLATAAVVVWPFTSSPGTARWVGAYDAPYNAWLGWRIGEAVREGRSSPPTSPTRCGRWASTCW